MKARFCREGARALVEFCQERGIDHEICGKVIAAVEPDELPLLDDLYERGLKNSIEVEKIGPEELREIEPHASGLAALKVTSTGIVDFAKVAEAFAAIAKENSGQLRTGTEVKSISETGGAVVMRADRGTFRAQARQLHRAP